MKYRYQSHSAFVGDWFGRMARGFSAEQLLDLFQQAIGAVWRSARTSISDVALDAVLERVVINARENFTWLPALPVVHNAIDVSVWRAQCGRIKLAETQKAARFLLTEFMAINGNLTGETLTANMQRSLLKIRRKKKPRDSTRSGENSK